MTASKILNSSLEELQSTMGIKCNLGEMGLSSEFYTWALVLHGEVATAKSAVNGRKP